MRYVNHQYLIVGICTLFLTGCNSDFYVSQNANIAQLANQSPNSIYYGAETAMKGRRYNAAIRYFKAFVKLHAQHEKVEAAHLHLIECYIARGQRKEALQFIDKFIRQYPNSSHRVLLEKKRLALVRKNAMDSGYHLAWMQDIKNNNKAQYGTLIKTIEHLRNKAKYE